MKLMKIAKMCCLMGFSSIIISAVAMTIIEHLPSPWGLGTLPGGMESIPPLGRPFWDEQIWPVHLIVFGFGVGFAGSVVLITGVGMALISKLKNKSVTN
jgi:hypothetical protein